MADFTVTITDQAELDGITWAKDAHNAQAEMVKGDAPDYSPDCPLIDSDQAYVQWVMQNAAKSYARQKQFVEGLPNA